MESVSLPLPHDASTSPGSRAPLVSWSVKHVGWSLLLFAAVLFLPQIPLAFVIRDLDHLTRNEALGAWVASGLSFVGIALVAVWFAARSGSRPFSLLGYRMPAWGTLGWAAVAFVGAFLIAFVYGVITKAAGWEQKCDDQIPLEIRRDALLLALFSFQAVVFAPVAEETYFRGFAFGGIARSWGVPAGIVFSGVLFGAAHLLGNPYLYKTFPLFAALGMLFAFCYSRNGNIFTTMLAHFSYNLVSVIFIASTTCNR
ncbi:MAG TPA: CPBP family intramembrane glutamic endopeptidase [Dehalococcoidia bacterium]|nr:CPBP family intramembrane glutamic endopeptidase [Dehalococcoidia bacterium]